VSTDPRIQALAAELTRKINAICQQRDAEMKALYEKYKIKAAAIRAEGHTSQSPEQEPENRGGGR
jgi:hypothetical protein